MNDIPCSNEEFAERLIKLDETFDYYEFYDRTDGEDEDIIKEEKNNIEADLVNHNTGWIRDWLTDIKTEIMSKLNEEDADYIGHIYTEADLLLQYLDKCK